MENQFTISSIICIVLLIVPGVFFKRFYFQGHFTKQFGAGLFADRLITSIFWGFLIQIITFIVFSKTFHFTYNSIRGPLSKASEELSKNNIPDFSTANLLYALSYLLASIFVAILSGTVLHRVVRFFKIDVKFKVLRFSNHWHYYFTGDILSSNDFKNSRRGKVLSTSVDVVMDGGDGSSKMVSGFLTQYAISPKTGELETIYLTGAERYSHSAGGFKPIPGDCLLIPYNKVIDLNLRYTIMAPTNTLKVYWERFTRIVGLMGTLFILIYPWFLSLSVSRIIVGIVLALCGWIFLLAMASNPFKALSGTGLKILGFTILGVLVTIFIILSMSVLKILSLV